MGGKGSGRKPLFDDDFHKLWRANQILYDREIRVIMKEKGCSFQEAQNIRNEQKRRLAQKELKRKLKEAEKILNP